MVNQSENRLDQLLHALTGIQAIVIVLHNDPDPDAIASAVGLRTLLRYYDVLSEIQYQGRIGRASNRALVEYLDHPMIPLITQPSLPTIYVDTQQGAGNAPLGVEPPALAVFDHHPWRMESARAAFADVRTIGATATMMTQYLRAANVPILPQLATALYYGIKTDTLDLERMTTRHDVTAYRFLEKLIDLQGLKQIQNAQVSADYFHNAHTALQAARLYDNLLISSLGNMPYPDLAAEMADWLMRFDGADWVVCCGISGDKVYLSVRAHPPRGGADELVRAIVAQRGSGGGHATMAGGQVPLTDDVPHDLMHNLLKNALDYLQITMPVEQGQKLLNFGQSHECSA